MHHKDEAQLTGFDQKCPFRQKTFAYDDFLYRYESHTSIETGTRLFLLFPDLSLEIPAEFQIRKSKSRDPQVCQLEGKKQNQHW